MDFLTREIGGIKEMIQHRMDSVQPENLQSTGGPSVRNHQCAERMWPCKLYSWSKELVAQGRIILADGPQMIHGKPLREDFYKVAIDIIIKGDVELPELDRYHSTLGFGEKRRAILEDPGILIGREVGKFIQLISTFVGGFVVAFVQGLLLTLVMLSSIPPLVLSGAAMAIMISKMASRGQTAYAEACFRGRGRTLWEEGLPLQLHRTSIGFLQK
ncbi:ABC transporter B family member 4-like [Magnolia sinica]|uniref:ABC transporter B family member 4-like n=1 Tax=Magnolia sinica TaxID=86752 RepID=UPI0026589DEF|nr:ABC transporter B family member 4-like [Magnolia sinica]XP_058102276.1 ABC transporter B family member 4-like [Magnolia sinica]